MTKIDPELIKLYQDLIIKHEAIVLESSALLDIYRSWIDKYTDNTVITPPNNTASTGNTKITHLYTPEGIKPTLRTILKDILANGQIPLSSNPLREKYNEVAGKNLDKVGFSPRLSNAAKTDLRIYEVAGSPIDTRYVYCLPEWFDGDELKQEYKDKIRAV